MRKVDKRQRSHLRYLHRPERRLNVVLIAPSVFVSCDVPTMHRYLKRRDAQRDSYKLNNWQDYLDSIDIDFRPHTDHSVIYNSADSPALDSQLDELSFLATPPESQ